MAAGEHNIVFYTDDGQIARRNPIWVQVTLEDMVRIFERVRLQTKLGNTKEMMFTLGLYWVQQGK